MIFELLGVWSPLGPAQQPVEQLNLPGPLERPEAKQSLVAALHEAVPDSAIGVYAAETLRLRGMPPADLPQSARAVLVLDRLEHLSYVESRFDRHAAEDAGPDQQSQPPGTAVCAAAAADWLGGPGNLLREFAAVGEPTDADILDLIGRVHPALMVAGAACAARDRNSSLGSTVPVASASCRARRLASGTDVVGVQNSTASASASRRSIGPPPRLPAGGPYARPDETTVCHAVLG